MSFPSDTQRGIPAWLTKLGPVLFRARYRTSVGDSNAANKVPVIIQGAASQTANLIEYYDSAKNLLRAVDPSGAEINNGGASLVQTAMISVSAANITDTGAGHLGHAAGVPLVADPGAGKAVELISAVMSFTYSTAQYTGGGNISVNINGGAALTGVVSAANSLGAAADKLVQLVPLATAGNALTVNKGLNLVAAAAFTQPGTAAGTVKVFVSYRIHTL
jgi:hypothetical protein